MSLSAIKKYRRRHRGLYSLYIAANYYTILGMMLPFVAATAVTLRGAVALSIEMLIISVPTAFLGALLCRRLAYWQKAAVYMGVATVMMVLGRLLITMIFPDIANYLGIYIYLLALTGMTLLEGRSRRASDNPVRALLTALLNTAVFGVIMVLVSLVREIIGNGTLWGNPVNIPFKLPGVVAPFFGLILMGFLGALMRATTRGLAGRQIAQVREKLARRSPRYIPVEIDLTKAKRGRQ